MRGIIFGILLVGMLAVLVLPLLAKADVTQTTLSSVTINEYVAIGMSNNLSSGIAFGSLDPNTNNNNATYNFYINNNQTGYYINVSSDSNVDVDICVGVNETLEYGSYHIENGNYTWVNSTANATDNEWLLVGNSVAMTLDSAYTKGGENIAPGNNNWFRFWLDIPLGQAAGTYVNQASFKGVKTGNACN
jgi:type II secretory pathway pseudopilin PulG